MSEEYGKPYIIKAEQFDGGASLFNKYHLMDTGTMSVDGLPSSEVYMMGVGKVNIGDWFLSKNDSVTVLSDKLFKEHYGIIPSIPKYMARAIDKSREYDALTETVSSINDTILDAVSYYYPSEKVGKWISNNGSKFALAFLLGYKTAGEPNVFKMRGVTY